MKGSHTHSANQRLVRFVLALLMLTVFSVPAFAAEDENGVSPSKKVESAILYTIDADNELEYNVVYQAAVTSETVVKDKTFNGINTVEKLKDVMGEADKPALVFGTDTGERTLGKAVTADLVIDGNGAVSSVTVTKVSSRPTVGHHRQRLSGLCRSI